MGDMKSDEPRRSSVSTDWLVGHCRGTSAADISATVSRLIRDGSIKAGQQLPTVRALAARLGVSPATVSAAWNTLRNQRVIEGGGRQGTWVLDRPALLAPQRFENISRFWSGDVLDLTLAAPDPALLPDPVEAMSKAARDSELNSYRRQSITTALESAVEPTWPWKPETMMAVNGGYEGLMLLAVSGFTPGQSVAVADPSTPRILDILELVGVEVIPVASDKDGPLPEALRRALVKQPVAFIYEPRASSRMGTSMSSARRDELANVLAGSSVLIVEDDGLGDLASDPYNGLGAVFPTQSVLVRSYAKSHGPDLRIAVMGGASDALERARVYRQFGAGWTSRLLQNALAWMLTSTEVQESVIRARETYAQRRQMMAQLLRDRGAQVENNDGLSLWVPVRNEHQALLVLASHGVAAGGVVGGAIASHRKIIRLTIGKPFDRPEHIADLYAMASIAV